MTISGTQEDAEIIKKTEIFHCCGHENVTGLHRSTFEITKDPEVTKKGTCIIGVSSDMGAYDLSKEFKEILKDSRTTLISEFEIEGDRFKVQSSGSKMMILDHKSDMVWRRSGFVCGRTIGIYSNCTASLIPRDIIKKIQTGTEIKVTLTALLNPAIQSPSVLHLQGIFHNYEEEQCRVCKE